MRLDRSMLRATLLLSGCLLAGCDFDPMKLLRALPGPETNEVVLSDQPVRLSEQGMAFTSREPMKVLGERSFLCLSLKGALPLEDSQAMDRSFRDAMGEARITVHLSLSDGTRIPLSKPLQAWRKYGVVAGSDELSACAAMPCKVRAPVVAEVKSVEISSAPALQVRGIFWTSEAEPVKAPAPPSTNARASELKESSTCRA